MSACSFPINPLDYKENYFLCNIRNLTKPKTWTEAQSYCREKYTDLAMVQSDEDRAKLKEAANTVNFQSVAWIGFYRDTWRWSYQNTPISYVKWDLSQPDIPDTNEACGVVNKKGLWSDRNCTVQDYFFCQTGKKLYSTHRPL
uniref:C-type lectin domain-containing protein n=1 Tax=Cyprinus carpio TaxID=7962 RepID=A0A8C1PVQ6_CYPCA